MTRITSIAARHLLRSESERMKQVLRTLGAVLGAAAAAAARLVAKIRRSDAPELVGLRRSFATSLMQVFGFAGSRAVARVGSC
jgi:hypothetical protein